MACQAQEVQGGDVEVGGWGGETIITNCPRAMVAKVQFSAIEADLAKLQKRAHHEEREGKRIKHACHYCAWSNPRWGCLQPWWP
jgi:hypothetical protein